jgi:2,3-bisphosphoglycerate-independent phosphoglycerate mutase
MAHVVLVWSGLADDPAEALDGLTPLEAAATPHLDTLAVRSEVGLLQPLPDAPSVGADAALLALLGYACGPVGRGALELLGAGVSLGAREVGLRLDLLSLAAGVDPFPAAPEPDEAERLWADLCPALAQRGLTVRGVRPLTALGVWSEGPVDVLAVPPGELADPETQAPRGDREGALQRLLDVSREVLADHPLNQHRRDQGLPTLDVLWPWGFGRAPELPLFVLRAGQLASVLSDHLAVRGVARAVGLGAPRLPAGTPRQAQHVAPEILAYLDQAPTVISHSNAPDRYGHQGDPGRKRDAIATLDRLVLAPLVKRAEREGDLDITLLGDYPCLCASRRHANRPVPYLAWRGGAKIAGPERCTELTAADAARERHGAGELRRWLWGR